MNNISRRIAIIQARMGSSRLPGKVLKLASGRSILDRMIERVKQAKTLNKIIVATTIDPSDDKIEKFCQQNKILVFRGSVQNVLDRYYQVAKLNQADIIVRLTGDCPLIDPTLIDDVVDTLITEKADFVCNRLPPPFSRTYPIGLDVEACTFVALEKTWINAKEKFEREHVMPYIYSSPGRFKVIQLNYKEELGHLRWTLDTQEDLLLLRRIYRYFKGKNDFSWLDVLNLYNKSPELFQINTQVLHKSYLEAEKSEG